MTAGRPKRHSASFRRVLVLVYGTVILFALLITGIYTVVSPQIFASNKISDLIPKGQIIAGYIESTLRGELSSTYLVPLIGRSTSQWEATVWVVDASGDTLIRTQQIEGRRVGRLPAKLSESMLPQVLSGEVATHVGSMEDLTVSDGASHRKSAWSSSVMNGLSEGSAKAPETDSTEEVMNGNLVVVAVPITFMDEVIGAVFMAQSMTEIMGGMQALTNTLALSLLLVGLLMLPVVLFFASRMVRPITRMRTVALTMAGGDLTVGGTYAVNAIDFYGLRICTCGLINAKGDGYTDRVAAADDSYKRLVFRDGKLVGYVLINASENAGIYTSLISGGVPLEGLQGDLMDSPNLFWFPKETRITKLRGGVQL